MSECLARLVPNLQELRHWRLVHNEIVYCMQQCWEDGLSVGPVWDRMESEVDLLRYHLRLLSRKHQLFLAATQGRLAARMRSPASPLRLCNVSANQNNNAKINNLTTTTTSEKEETMTTTMVEELNALEDRLLGANENKYVPRSVGNAALYAFYDQLQKSFWGSHEIDYSEDAQSWQLLKPNEQRLLKHVFAFFVVSDGMIIDNLSCNFMEEITSPAVRQFYALQTGNESVHARAYNDVLDIVIQDTQEKQGLYDAVNNMQCITAKCQFMQTFMDRRRRPFVERLVAFACVEGIFFQGGFSVLMWAKSLKRRKQILKGTCIVTEWIVRDENLHLSFACHLYRELARRKLTQEAAVAVVKQAVYVEISFFEEALREEVPDITLRDMTEYVQFCGDRVLVMLGHSAHWKSTNPFSFALLGDLDSRTNFFEQQSTYTKSAADSFAETDDF